MVLNHNMNVKVCMQVIKQNRQYMIKNCGLQSEFWRLLDMFSALPNRATEGQEKVITCQFILWAENKTLGWIFFLFFFSFFFPLWKVPSRYTNIIFELEKFSNVSKENR